MSAVEVKGDEQVIQHFERIPATVRSDLLNTVRRLSIGLQKYIVTNKLSGQVLKRRTGTLARSIQQDVTDSSSGVIGLVGSRIKEGNPLKYARPHEYGFQGIVTVKEHLRMQTMAWGKAITPKQVTVRAHEMHMNIAEKSFMRSSLAENAQKIRDELNASVMRGVKQ